MGVERKVDGAIGAMGQGEASPGDRSPAASSPPGDAEARASSETPRERAETAERAARPSRRAEAGIDGDRRRWTGPAIAIGLTMGAAAIAALVLTGMQDNAIYSKPVDQLIAQKTRFVGRPVRADGLLVHGSLARRDQPCEYRFTIAKGGVELPVRFAQCVVPDTFRDVADIDVGVTVEGELQRDDTFEATSVLAKCPSKYEMQEKRQRGEQMPHGALAEESPPAPATQARALP